MAKSEAKKAVRNFTQTKPVKGNTPRAYMDTPMGNKAQKARGGGGTIRTKMGKIPNK